MKGRLPLILILGGSLAFLASLYLTWISATPKAGNNTGVIGLLDLLSASGWNGWGIFGQAAALAAIVLIALVLVGLRRPDLADSLPFGGCATALATLALVNAADLRTDIIYRSGYDHITAHLGTGTYVGGCAVLVGFVGVGLRSSDEPFDTGPATIGAATLLTVGLVAAYVLPTAHVHPYRPNGTGGFQFVHVGNSGTAVMLLIGSFGLTFWLGGPPIRRIASAAVVLVLTVGGFSTLGTHLHWPYEAWLAIGCAAGLLVLSLATSGRTRTAWPIRPHALALEGAALLLASLFLNWEKSCPSRGTCFVSNGWTGGLSGGLVAILVVLLLGFRRFAPELAIAIGIYAVGTGLAITAFGALAYGAYLGFAGAALLLLAAARQPRTLSLPGVRVIPAIACLAYVAIPALAMTDRIEEFRMHRPWFLSLVEAAAIVVGLRLCGRWIASRAGDAELLPLSVALLVLTGLNLGEIQHVFFLHWESWVALSLSAFLVLSALVERNGGIPEAIWRIDRLPTVED